MQKRSWTQSFFLAGLFCLGLAFFIFLEKAFPHAMFTAIVIGGFCGLVWMFRNMR